MLVAPAVLGFYDSLSVAYRLGYVNTLLVSVLHSTPSWPGRKSRTTSRSLAVRVARSVVAPAPPPKSPRFVKTANSVAGPAKRQSEAMRQPLPSGWLWISEVAARAQCSVRLVRMEVRSGRLRAFRSGSNTELVCRVEHVDQWLQDSTNWRLRNGAEGFVYFISKAERRTVKIGWTQQTAEERRRQLQTASSERLELLGFYRASSVAEESGWHERWAHLRTPDGGVDWFALSPELLSAIDAAVTS